ncbi:hypothetical protein J2X03_002411 [Microbacterium trichothecenolyticum]|uniref:DUF6541 family protein n=1 Tax=Microbacterium trichothecenolyticum TaxID=69370 RepID=UPI002854D980|nr:DUF6541 family protein [Microbacterium trichothecenolyticum]MDR7112516.1 hypothetical protein [Microbacterium trichothecenolyticum]
MAWLSLAWSVVAALLILGVLGIPLARIIGLRGFAQFGMAPAFAMTVICGASIVTPWVGLPWSMLSVLIVAVLLGALLAAARYLTRRFRPAPVARTAFDGWLLLAILSAAALIAWRVTAIVGDPSHFSQTFDNVFHLNAVRYVLDTGNASSLAIGYMTNPDGPPTFYPAGWHALASLVAQVSGATVPVTVNAVTIAVSAVVWPTGVVLLTRTFFGRSPALSIAAALLAASMPAYPVLLMDYGVLYPFQLGVALVPAALAAAARTLRLGHAPDGVGSLWWAVALAGTVPGIVLSHPGAFVALVAVSSPMVAVFIVRRWIAVKTRRERWIIAGFTACYLVAGFLTIYVLRPPLEARGWPPVMSVWDAIVTTITVAPWYGASAVIAALAAVLGIVWVIVVRTPQAFAVLGMYIVTSLLFVVVASLTFPQIRDAFTAPWYNNVPRLVALMPMALVPLGAFGVARTLDSLRRRVGMTDEGRRRWLVPAAGVAVAVVAGAAMQVGPLSSMPVAERWAAAQFVVGPDSALVSTDEAALLLRLDEHVPPGVAIAGSPWTGTSVAYALTGRPVLMPHVQMEISDALQEINDELAQAEAGDEVCAALDQLGVRFVLDFPGREVHNGEHVYPGLVGLANSDSVRLVDQQGDARLYQIVACDA